MINIDIETDNDSFTIDHVLEYSMQDPDFLWVKSLDEETRLEEETYIAKNIIRVIDIVNCPTSD